jgi:hypothetical protein
MASESLLKGCSEDMLKGTAVLVAYIWVTLLMSSWAFILHYIGTTMASESLLKGCSEGMLKGTAGDIGYESSEEDGCPFLDCFVDQVLCTGTWISSVIADDQYSSILLLQQLND